MFPLSRNQVEDVLRTKERHVLFQHVELLVFVELVSRRRWLRLLYGIYLFLELFDLYGLFLSERNLD